MNYCAMILLYVALGSGLLGFGGLAYTTAGLAQGMFFISLLAFVVIAAIKLMQTNRDL